MKQEFESSRAWMRELARLRSRVVQLRRRAGDADEAMPLVEESFEMIERLREHADALLDRCVDLQADLDRERARTHELFDLFPTPAIVTDCAGIIADANPAAAALLGRSARRLVDQLLLHFAEDRDRFASMVRELPHATAPLQVRLRFRPQERAPFDADVTVVPAPRDGAWLWFLVRQDQPRRASAVVRGMVDRAAGASGSQLDILGPVP